MYRVIIYNGTTSTVIHEPSADPRDAHLYECSLVQGSSGEIDSLSFTITPNNPGYENLFEYATFIEVVDLRSKGEAAIFSGRVLSVGPQMEESGLVYKNVVCEDRLGFLNDSIQPYTPMDTYTVREFLELLLNNHNAQVEDYKKIYVGTVSFSTSSGNVTKSLNYQSTWEAITSKLLELGGEIQLYTLNGLLYIDYVTELGTMGDQTIEIAKNMRSLQQDKSPTDIITRLVPLGDYLEEQTGESDDRERLNIASVNGGKTYIDDEDAIAAYGIIMGTVVWEDVTLPENLLEKGKQWLEDQNVQETISLSAYDLYAAGIDPDVIERYNYYRTINPLVGIDKYYRVAKKTTNIIDPTDVTFTIGAQSTSLSSTVKRTGQDAADAAAAINANLSKTVATLIAGNAIIQYLEATVAEIETAYIDKAYIDELLAQYATIEYLEASYATIVELQAAFADVELLNADVANIITLLSGSAGIGDLQAIVLTTENAVIEDLVVINALADTILADIIQSNTIITDYITVRSEDGGITIIGNQMQIVDGQLIFYDENGNVRMQVGQDTSGNFSFILYDETGTGIMIDSEGVHESAIPDGLIVDAMVAGDANIAASKLDIADLTKTLNENGDLIIDAMQVTIDGETLDYRLTEITEQIGALESEGIQYVINYYALGGPDEPPGEGESNAVLGEAILGVMILGSVGWTTERLVPGEGEYLWYRQLLIYYDGHTEWTTPTLITDDYIRSKIVVQETELEVVQGMIQARVWETDIIDYITPLGEEINTITEQYGVLTVLLDEIDARVGSLTTTVGANYMELSEQVASINIVIDNISLEVRDVYEKTSNAIVEGIPYYAVSFSPYYYPPFEWEDNETAVLGEAILGSMILGTNGVSNWTTEQPEYAEGQYVWVSYLRTRVDGSTYWTTPTLLTDDALQDSMTIMSERYSRIVLEVDSIREEVAYVYSELTDNYSTTKEIRTLIEQTVTEEAGTILLEVSYEYVHNDTLKDYYTAAETNAQIEMQASQTSASIISTVSATYSGKSETVSDGSTLYALSTNPDFYPPLTPEGYQTAVLGEAILGEMILGVTKVDAVEGSHSEMFDLEAGESRHFEVNVELEGYVPIGIISYEIDGAYFTEEPKLTRNTLTFDVQNGNNTTSSVTVQVALSYSRTDVWSTNRPDEIPEGYYLWVCYEMTYADGSIGYTEPICLTDDLSDFVTWSHMEATIEQYVGEEEAYIKSYVEGAFVTKDGLSLQVASIEEYIDAETAAIRAYVEGTYVTATGMTDAIAEVKLYVEQEYAALESTVKETYATGDALTEAIASVREYVSEEYSSLESTVKETYATGEELTESIASIEQYVDRSMASITLKVSGGLGGTASIVLTSGSGSSSADIDLKDVREAFANDNTSVTIGAGTITFVSGTLIIESEQFQLDSAGNATFSGNLSAPTGTIGGFTIANSALYTGSHSSFSATTSGVFVGTDGISLGSGFSVNTNGYLTATSGQIGGWNIGYRFLYDGTGSMSSTTDGTYIGTNGIRQYSGGNYLNITAADLVNGDSSNNKAELTSGILQFYHAGTLMGHYGTNYYVNEPSKYGMVIDSEYEASFIGFARKTSSSATMYTFDYLINYGLSTSIIGRNEKHIFWGDVGLEDNLNVTGNITMGGNTVATQEWVNEQISGGIGGVTEDWVKEYVSGLNYIDSNSLNNTLDSYVRTNASVSYSVSNGSKTVTGSCRPFTTGLVLNLSDLFSDIGGSGSEFTADRYYVTQSSNITMNAATIWFGKYDDSGSGVGIYSEANGNIFNLMEFIGSAVEFGTEDLYTYIYGGRVEIGESDSGIYIYGEVINIGNSDTDIRFVGSRIVFNSSVIHSSDQRLKTSIKPLEVRNLDNLIPVEFEWKKDEDHKKHFGYIAQDVQEHIPELVSEGEDGMLGLAYTEIIPLLHLEIMKLKEQVKQLQKGATA